MHDCLANESYRPSIYHCHCEKSIAPSVCFGLYDGDRQIGFARVTTGYATFAYLAAGTRDAHGLYKANRWECGGAC